LPLPSSLRIAGSTRKIHCSHGSRVTGHTWDSWISLPDFVSGGFPVFIDSQPFLGKRTARSRFEVALKFAGPLPVTERNGGFDAPGTELHSVGDFASIVPAQPLPKVIGQANVEGGVNIQGSKLRY